MNKHQTYTEYLEDICFEENPQVLDDDMPDFFDNWLAEQDVAQYIEWGDKYGEQFKEKLNFDTTSNEDLEVDSAIEEDKGL